ncbi:ATP-binding protein [Ancylobacter sp. MQZ15Z-1]|uniref:histidine kinase n=1 Tax=Ancylobacter mangrovi TaxID=2972472 RepID=A0A9X2PC59_9HYPH|nr:ATP-binding protein [Ancylobacter mangrovi]MCS0495941.1 ATP-binding protein [Ancylobacter mangrovi]
MDDRGDATGHEDTDIEPGKNWQMAVLATILAAAIFALDTFSPVDMAIAVLYVVVVLLAANYVERRGLLAISGLCVGLTLASFFIIHGDSFDLGSVMRCAVSIAAITVTTLLSLRNQDATDSLKEQAALLDLTHDAIFVRDTEDVIRYWSQGAQELYGWTRAEAVGRNAADLLKTAFPHALATIRRELLQTGRWEGELTHTRKDGSRVTVMSRWSLQRDERGRPAATMETNSDLTERRRAEDALHQTRTQLTHVTRITTLGELTASIAHEINQPLAAVVTNGAACLRWLDRPEPDIGEAKASVERMISNGRRASDVVARLRALARRSEPQHTPLDVNEVVEEMLQLLERELAQHRIALELAFDRHVPAVAGDRVQLQQVLINLSLNAMQAMDAVPPRGRRLGIVTRAEQDEEGRAVVIEVRDRGPGIAPENLPKLFNAFYSTKQDGMGMGLSISRSIIEAHGGRIAAAPNETGGMTFAVRLPVPEDEPT